MHGCDVRGFSLVELMVVVVLLAFTAAFALPQFNRLIERMQARALTEQLLAQLSQARAQSVIRHRDVTVCGSADGINCIGDWSQGWIVRMAGDNEPISWQQLDGARTLRWRGFASTIVFRANGTAPMGNGRFYICDASAEVQWQLVLNRQGRVRHLQGPAAADGGGGSDPCR